MAEPITLAQAKAQCRIVDDTSEDALLTSYIKAAREYVENYTGHILVQREIVEQWDIFGTFLELHRRPIVEVSEIGYVDTDGAAQTYGEDIVVQSSRFPARVFPAPGVFWPTLWTHGGVTITYTAGYEAGEEPQPLIQAMLLLVAHWFEHRTASEQQGSRTAYSAEVPFAVAALCDQYRAPGL